MENQNTHYVLAFDFGASSGRAILGALKDGKIEMKEIHRFSNDPVIVNGTMYWDTLRQFFEIKQGIVKAKKYGTIDSMGIDTWGVDFGLLDADGHLLVHFWKMPYIIVMSGHAEWTEKYLRRSRNQNFII